MKRQYGITVEHFDRMFAEQNGLCAICLEAPAAHVDHDHETGRVRGLLCFNCNGALGQLRDRLDVLQRAIAYLGPDGMNAAAGLAPFQAGFFVGDSTSHRPDDEPPAWETR